MRALEIYNEDYKKIHADFSQMIIAKGYARGVDNIYPNYVLEFLFFLESIELDDLKKVLPCHILAFYEYLKERPNQRKEGGLSEITIRQALHGVDLLFNYLIDTGVLEGTPVYLPKFTLGKYKQRSILSAKEVQQLYAACENPRERVLLSLAYGCGLRRMEITRLDCNDIDLKRGFLSVRKGKFGKSRTIPLSDKVITDIRTYLVSERPQLLLAHENNPSFLISNWGTRTIGTTLGNYFKQIISRIKDHAIRSKNITLHCLRHSIATHLIDNGAQLEFVRRFLGHVFIDTTHIYISRRKQKQFILNQFNNQNETAA